MRDKAVEAIGKIGAVLAESAVSQHLFPLIKRLATGDWFTSRVSSAALFAVAYPAAPVALKTELRALHLTLCHDETPMVRRAAAANLGKFAAKLEKEYVKSEIMSLFTELTQDGACEMAARR